ncbi:MAG: S24 family peptidase, partial [Thermodesulfovibrionales bacterium]|nr:S24 family peptidase [Thermodesulfovibrionales bacterium]
INSNRGPLPTSTTQRDMLDKEDREIISGKIYAVWLPNEGAVLRRIFTDIDKIILKPDNPSFPVIPILPEDIKRKTPILGRLKWVMQLL